MSDATLIRSSRNLAELTQAELAKRLNISQTLLSLYESGKRPVPPYMLDLIMAHTEPRRKAKKKRLTPKRTK